MLMRLPLCQDCTSVELKKMWCMAEAEGGGRGETMDVYVSVAKYLPVPA